MKKNLYKIILALAVTFSGLAVSFEKANAQGGCQAMFSFTVDTNTNSVQFTDQSFGNYTYTYWTFGDGFTSTQTNPNHVYFQQGIYYACLTIGDSISGCQSTYCDTIFLGVQPPCNAYFAFSAVNSIVTFNQSLWGNYAYYTWDFGDGSPVVTNQSNPIHTYSNPGTYTACLTAYDAQQNALCSYCQTITIQGAPTDTLCGYIFWDTNGNGLMDAGENGIQSQVVAIYGMGVQYTVQTNGQGFYSVPLLPGNYTVYYCTNITGAIFTVPADSFGCAFYNAVVTAGGNNCGYNFGLQNTGVIIEGTVFNDANNNGVLDAGESGIPYQGVQVGAWWAYTDGNGNYSITRPAGTYNVSYTPTGPYAGYSLTTPGTITVNATTIGNTYGGNNFGIYITPGSVNLSVNITPHTTVTPGFPAWYDILVCNIGAMPTGATLTMNYDPGLTFISASPAQASINTTTHTITWNIPTLATGDCDYIWIDFDASASYNIGDNTYESAYVIPTNGTDIDMSNNVDTVHQIVTGSWDPNNKLSVETNTTNPNEQIISSVNPDQWIEYTINFQNMGTAAAVNIVVIDQLSADLDANTFEMINTSHPCSVMRNGSDLNFLFTNIMLPDHITNEPASHGFITFRVKAVNGLLAGHIISDNAAIYFDFNQPVITNFANVTMINPLGVNEIGNLNYDFHIYPNPASGSATIEYELKESAAVMIEVFDAIGKKVSQMIDENQSIGTHLQKLDITPLESGIYMVKLRVNGKAGLFRLSVF